VGLTGFVSRIERIACGKATSFGADLTFDERVSDLASIDHQEDWENGGRYGLIASIQLKKALLRSQCPDRWIDGARRTEMKPVIKALSTRSSFDENGVVLRQ
jgi:hypothetical protein